MLGITKTDEAGSLTSITSNEFTVSPVCSSSLQEEDTTKFELTGLCVPKNPNLRNPEPIYPIQNTELDSTTTTFQWSSVPEATTYSLYVRNENTGILEIDQENMSTTSYTTSILKPNASYRWNVRAKNTLGGGWLSELAYFRVTANDTTPQEVLTINIMDEEGNPVNEGYIPVSCYGEDNRCDMTVQSILSITNGKLNLYKRDFPTQSVRVFLGENNSIVLNIVEDFKRNLNEGAEYYAIKDKERNDRYTLYRGYKTNDNSEFIEGMLDEMSIEFSMENLALGAGIDAMTRVMPVMTEMIAKKAGSEISKKFLLKFIPGAGWVLLAGAVGYTAYDSFDDLKYCVSQSTHIDEDTNEEHQNTYFCGKIAIKGALIWAGVRLSRMTEPKIISYRGVKNTTKLFANTSTMDEIGNIAKANKLNPISESAHLVYGYFSTAENIVKKLGWDEFVPNNPQPGLKIYQSSDGLERIQYRNFASSEVPDIYRHEATVDLMRLKSPGGKVVEGSEVEIKFVTQR